MNTVKRSLKVSLAKQDKPCAARGFPSWGCGVKPSSGVRGFLKIHIFPSQNWLILADISLESASVVTGLFSFLKLFFSFCWKLVRPWPENRTLYYGLKRYRSFLRPFTSSLTSLSAGSRPQWWQWQYLPSLPWMRSLFAEDIFCVWTRMRHCSRSCGLRLGVTSLWIRNFYSRDQTTQEKTGTVSFFFFSHRTRSSEAQAEEGWGNRLVTCGQPYDMDDQWRSSGSCVWNQATYVTSLFFAWP